MSLVTRTENRAKLCKAPSWFRFSLSHLPFQPPWQLNASSNKKPSVRAGAQLLGAGGTLRRLTPSNVTSELIESTGVSVILLLRQHWRRSACMWHIQAKQEKCGKNTHMPSGLSIQWHALKRLAKPWIVIEFSWREKTWLSVKTPHSVIIRSGWKCSAPCFQLAWDCSYWDSVGRQHVVSW